MEMDPSWARDETQTCSWADALYTNLYRSNRLFISMMVMFCYRNGQVVGSVLCSKSGQQQGFYDDIYRTQSGHEGQAYLLHAIMKYF